jgi:hypothetical protein
VLAVKEINRGFDFQARFANRSVFPPFNSLRTPYVKVSNTQSTAVRKSEISVVPYQ